MKLSLLIESTAWMLALYAYYRLALARAAWFQFNRFFLLLLIPLGWAIAWVPLPFVSLGYEAPVLLEWNAINIEVGTAEEMGFWNVKPWLIALYAAGVGLAALRTVYRLGKVLWLIATSPERFAHEDYTLIPAQGRLATASFFRYIFWDFSLPATEEVQQQILAHERCHVRQRHSLDLLLMEFFSIVLWFHPLVYLIRRELVQTHEYLADQEAVRHGDKARYVSLMLECVLGTRISLTHSFFHSPVNNRIMMLTKPQPLSPGIRYLLLAPLCAVLLILSSCNQQSAVMDMPDPAIDALVEVDTAPIPTNFEQIQREVGYPREAADQGVEGTVVARVLLDESGKYVKHEIVKGDHALLVSAVEAKIGMLECSPALKAGKAVRFWVSLPFNFKLLK